MEEMLEPKWLSGKRINEVRYADMLRLERPMIWKDGAFFDVNGRVHDENALRQRMYRDIRDYVTDKVSAKVESMMQTLRMACGNEDLPLQETVIHVANGTYRLCEGFSPYKEICRFRLPVNYDESLPNPHKWMAFLDELLEPEDILTLQEFMGYCLIPTTAAQKMLIITGRGGEGKSRIGYVMRGLLGENMNMGSVAKLESSPFARADLEHKLVMVDDDLKLERLPSTNYVKTIITAEQAMDLERKGVQSYQGRLYARLMAFGNGSLRSSNDASYGFFRRQIILSTKPRPQNRVDNPFLGRELLMERDQIFLWCLTGLYRLIENDFQFTHSARARKNLTEAQAEGNPVVSFLRSKSYLFFGQEHYASTRQLYQVYRDWSEDNSMSAISMEEFSRQLRQEAECFDLRFSYNIPVGNGRRARGYKGIAPAPRV